MFFHIASIEREVYWQLGNVVCSAYPLKNLDTIHSEVFTAFYASKTLIITPANISDRRAANSFCFESDCVWTKAGASRPDRICHRGFTEGQMEQLCQENILHPVPYLCPLLPTLFLLLCHEGDHASSLRGMSGV